jgi:prevent-host-death family protein
VKNNWQVQDAKAKFSEFLNACLNEGPQIVTRRGTEEAVLIPISVWNKLKDQTRPTLKSLLLSPSAHIDLEIPQRGKAKRRPTVNL